MATEMPNEVMLNEVCSRKKQQGAVEYENMEGEDARVEICVRVEICG
jgi:hypothetical protein